MGWSDLLSGALRVGSVYVQHTKFVQTALSADPAKQYELLRVYVEGLTDAAFSGFKITALMLANNESDGTRKAAIQSLLRDADGARGGAQQPKQPLPPISNAKPEIDDDFEAIAPMLEEWFGVKDESRRFDLLIDYLMTLDHRKYSEFAARMQNLRTRHVQAMKDHEAQEINAWGSYMEDRWAYIMAREKTGAKDPDWQRAHNELVGHLEYFDWIIQASEGAWGEIAKRRKD
jgi:hypothetical protein